MVLLLVGLMPAVAAGTDAAILCNATNRAAVTIGIRGDRTGLRLLRKHHHRGRGRGQREYRRTNQQ